MLGELHLIRRKLLRYELVRGHRRRRRARRRATTLPPRRCRHYGLLIGPRRLLLLRVHLLRLLLLRLLLLCLLLCLLRLLRLLWRGTPLLS